MKSSDRVHPEAASLATARPRAPLKLMGSRLNISHLHQHPRSKERGPIKVAQVASPLQNHDLR